MRRSRVRFAFQTAERDLSVSEIIDALGMTGQQYSNFKRDLVLGKVLVNKSEQWLVKKRYLDRPRTAREHSPPYPDKRPAGVAEVNSILLAMLDVSADTNELTCSAAQLGFLEAGARRIAEDLVPLLYQQLEEDSLDKKAL